MLQILMIASYETIKLVFISIVLTILLGTPLGLLLEATTNPQILGPQYIKIFKILHKFVNLISNIPIFLILLISISIIDNLLHEYFTIQLSTAISISFIGIAIFANNLFKCLNNLPKELSETAKFLGAKPRQILINFLLPQAITTIVKNIIIITIKLFNLAIIASMLVDLDGLGKLAIDKGFREGELIYLCYVIICATSIVLICKTAGFLLVNYLENQYNGHGKN